MRRFFHLLDTKLLSIFTILFLIIVPLYPKFPFIRVPNTYISIRLEDFYVALMAAAFAVQLLRHRVHIDRPFLKYVVLFWLVVTASFFFNTFVTNAILHPNIGLLHSLRRVEYMIPYFVAYAAFMLELRHHAKPNELFARYIRVVVVVLLLVCVYALGQKYSGIFLPVRTVFEGIANATTGPMSSVAYFFFRFFDFPAVQTMNSEFAKGILLNLTPESRVSSTFAGHYDLAAYLVFLIPIIASVLLENWKRPVYFIAFVFAILTLILTASRISFIAYVLSMSVFFISQRKIRWLLLTILVTGVLMTTNQSMTQRFKESFQVKTVFVNEETGAIIVDQTIQADTLPAGTTFVPVEKKPESKARPRLTQEEQVKLERRLIEKELEDARKGGEIITAEEARRRMLAKRAKELQEFVARDVVATDISASTRFQVVWPRAIKAFLSNPLLGTGPGSITESTDNDYLRWLSETGLLGTMLFIFLLSTLGKNALHAHIRARGRHKLFYGYLFGLGALVINASYIDVFEASKVAFTFWTLSGIFMAYAHTLLHHNHTS